MSSVKLLSLDRTIIGTAILYKECNQFYSITISPSYCMLTLTSCIRPYLLEILDPFENYNNLSQLSIASIFVDHTFTEWSDVERYINTYAMKQGFATRLGCTERYLGLITRAEVICYCSGIASNKSNGLRETKSIAIGCPFKIVICWAKFEYQYHISGVPVSTIINMLTEEYDKYIHNKNIYNTLNGQARDHIKGLSQIAELLNNLQNKNEYIVTYSIKDNKLCSLFFTTTSSLMLFKHYLEVIQMNTIYKTNRFEMPLLLISGIDAMSITFLIASRLLSNETISSFHWILQQLKQVTSNIIDNVQTVLTDKDLALLSSI
ncbi:2079_t:CDS:2 [Cetraspora pellucida]|uniref:2079_t:CDS:1 n=1 Tax=Cetraspora pellucida TaxID=1433469 RepID=A0A9N9IN55_9GLOM|nr:2079_t:CDS:2 [Cetraspora pellucida]